MAEPYLGEIQFFAFNYAPNGWAFCNGAELPTMQNSALYALLGTRFGGNDPTTFRLPNLTGRLAGGSGSGVGLSSRTVGQSYGANDVVLSVTEMPSHNHALTALLGRGVARSATPSPGGGLGGYVDAVAYDTGLPGTAMSGLAISTVGAGTAHANVQPVLAMNPCIAVEGIYPSFD